MSRGVVSKLPEIDPDPELPFIGEFWSREMRSDVDLSDMPRSVDAAICHVCNEIEQGRMNEDEESKWTLATIFVKSIPTGMIVIARRLGAECAVSLTRCERCGAPTLGDIHPLNGCEVVMIEEIMCA